MDRTHNRAGVRRGNRRARRVSRGTTYPGEGRRQRRAMADSGAPHQGNARYLRAGCRGHDIPRGPPRSWNPSQPPHPLQRESHLRTYLFY